MFAVIGITGKVGAAVALGSLPMPVAFLRAAWFMDNAAWGIDSARRGAKALGTPVRTLIQR